MHEKISMYATIEHFFEEQTPPTNLTPTTPFPTSTRNTQNLLDNICPEGYDLYADRPYNMKQLKTMKAVAKMQTEQNPLYCIPSNKVEKAGFNVDRAWSARNKKDTPVKHVFSYATMNDNAVVQKQFLCGENEIGYKGRCFHKDILQISPDIIRCLQSSIADQSTNCAGLSIPDIEDMLTKSHQPETLKVADYQGELAWNRMAYPHSENKIFVKTCPISHPLLVSESEFNSPSCIAMNSDIGLAFKRTCDTSENDDMTSQTQSQRICVPNIQTVTTQQNK